MEHTARHIELHAILILLGGVATLFTESLIYLVVCGLVAFGTMWYRRIKHWNSDGVLIGIANTTTLTRLAVLMAAVLCYDCVDPFVFGLIVLAVIIADGLDGYLARKYKLESDFGALFDMETDAFLTAAVSTVIVLYFDFGVIPAVVILFAGYLRYLFVLTLRILRFHDVEKPHMPYAKILAVIYFISLTVPFLLTFPITSDFASWNLGFGTWSLYLGAFCVIVSFAYEFILILRGK